MDHVKVDSSNIDSVGYCPEARSLEVRFTNGALYSYADVTPEVHAAFMAAESKGKHFHRHIRPLPAVKVEPT